MAIRHKWLTDGYLTTIDGGARDLSPDDLAVLRSTSILRFDPANSCNASCAFCDSSFGDRRVRLDLGVYRAALSAAVGSPVLRVVQIGCAYEPTLNPELRRFGECLFESGVWRRTRVVTVVSNCLALVPHDMKPFVLAGMNKLHASVHASDTETARAIMGRQVDIDRIAANIREFKSAYPHVPVCVVCVVTRLNAGKPAQLLHWLLFHVRADYVRFTRARVFASRAGSPSFQAAMRARRMGEQAALELSDEEWGGFAVQVAGSDPARITVEAGSQQLKGATMWVDTLHARRSGAVDETRAISQARVEREAYARGEGLATGPQAVLCPAGTASS